jgi:hypothetical protein
MWCSALWCRRFRIHRYVAAPSTQCSGSFTQYCTTIWCQQIKQQYDILLEDYLMYSIANRWRGRSNIYGSLFTGLQAPFQNHWFLLFIYIKGDWCEILVFRFFSCINFPRALQYPIGAISNFYENSRRYLQLCFHCWCRWHWLWNICNDIIACLHLVMNIKSKILIRV